MEEKIESTTESTETGKRSSTKSTDVDDEIKVTEKDLINMYKGKGKGLKSNKPKYDRIYDKLNEGNRKSARVIRAGLSEGILSELNTNLFAVAAIVFSLFLPPIIIPLENGEIVINKPTIILCLLILIYLLIIPFKNKKYKFMLQVVNDYLEDNKEQIQNSNK